MSSLKLEEGKFYRSRDGRKFGPLKNDGIGEPYVWRGAAGWPTWMANGAGHSSVTGPTDLVAEWVDEQAPAPCCAPGGDGCPDCTDAASEFWGFAGHEAKRKLDALAAAAETEAQEMFSRTLYADTGELPERVKILHDGASLTNGDRDDEYGPPANNMTCAGELKAVFRKWLARDMSPGELEALDMAMTKLSRLSCGKPKRDTYVDAATYIAIAGEIALAPTA